jgi:F-type H+-transporting ATPase subunit epsilon
MALISNQWIRGLGEKRKSGNSVPVIRSLQSASPASPKFLKVSVVAPGKLKWLGSARFVILPSPSGEFGILPGHVSLTTCLDVGALRIRVQDQQVLALVVLGGFAQIEGDEVIILAAGVEQVDELEPNQAFAAVEAAEAELNQAQDSIARQNAQKRLKQAYARWQAASLLLSCSALNFLT